MPSIHSSFSPDKSSFLALGPASPTSFPLHDTRGRYPVAALADWLMKELRDLADRFDARNGNGYFKERIAELETHKKLIAPLPVPVRGQ